MTTVLVLCYHAVSAEWDAPLSTTPDNLERQLAFLAHRGWHASTFTDAVMNPPARKTVAVTFDDAFLSVRELALPVLTSLRWPATVFAPTAFMAHRQALSWAGIDHWQTTAYAMELLSMDWSDLGELTDAGWEIGSHTRTHPRLTTLTDSDLDDELRESRQMCAEHLGRACTSIAYPYGDVNARVASAALRAGYAAGAGLSSSLRPKGPLQYPRVGIYHVDVDRRFRLKMAPITRRLRASRMWPSQE